MPIEIGDSTATVRSKINAVLTDAGLDPADNVDTTAATALLNEAAGLWGVDVEFTDRMPEAEFRTAFAELEEGVGVPAWVPLDANGVPFAFYADFITGHFWFDGQRHGSYEAWLEAMGGTDGSGVQFTFPWDTTVGTYFFEGVAPLANEYGMPFQIDSGVDTNATFLRRDAPGRVMRYQSIRLTATQMDLSTGAIGEGYTTRHAISIDTNAGRVSWNGETAQNDTQLTVPTGITTFRVGNRVAADRPWNGEIWKLAGSRTPSNAIQVQGYAMPDQPFFADGDSYMAGSLMIGIANSVVEVGKRFVKSGAVGGSTLEQAVARVEANAWAGSHPLLFCDGDPNGYGTTASDMARYARLMAATGGDCIIATPCPRSSQDSGVNTASKDLTTALLAAYPGKVVSTYTVGETLAAGSGGNVSNTILQGDGIHPGTAFANAIAAAMLDLATDL